MAKQTCLNILGQTNLDFSQKENKIPKIYGKYIKQSLEFTMVKLIPESGQRLLKQTIRQTNLAFSDQHCNSHCALVKFHMKGEKFAKFYLNKDYF